MPDAGGLWWMHRKARSPGAQRTRPSGSRPDTGNWGNHRGLHRPVSVGLPVHFLLSPSFFLVPNFLLCSVPPSLSFPLFLIFTCLVPQCLLDHLCLGPALSRAPLPDFLGLLQPNLWGAALSTSHLVVVYGNFHQLCGECVHGLK